MSDVFLDDQIRDLVMLARDHQRTIAETETAIYHIKAQLAQLLELRGTNWSDDDGYACLAQEDRQISYNTRALDELIQSDPLQYGWLREHRREIPIPQRVQIITTT